ncbi:hypothetical protein ARMSODRAFT_961087 [Armillaria solidipes]|uniref:Uncharacterized protein n=1 Tax=Armillaria solidipes TaxID=1076256 RepID=A0A2H3B492_9AGAR|nr:hypothetical protein ARMSODRAFT_961087 [Armillaria solidipes]
MTGAHIGTTTEWQRSVDPRSKDEGTSAASLYQARLPKVEASDQGHKHFQLPSPSSWRGDSHQSFESGVIRAICEPSIKVNTLRAICNVLQHTERLFKSDEARI